MQVCQCLHLALPQENGIYLINWNQCTKTVSGTGFAQGHCGIERTQLQIIVLRYYRYPYSRVEHFKHHSDISRNE